MMINGGLQIDMWLMISLLLSKAQRNLFLLVKELKTVAFLSVGEQKIAIDGVCLPIYRGS